MKTIISTAIFLFAAIGVNAQNNNLVIYSQDGLRFTVILNGIRQNMEPQTNVKITGLDATNYQAKLIFENKMPDLNQNVYLMYGGNPTKNTEYSYSLTKVKEKYKLKLKSATEFKNTIADPQQTVVVFNPQVGGNIATSGTQSGVSANGAAVQNTTTTVTSTSTAAPANANIDMNVNGMGVGMNVTVSGTSTGTQTNTSNTQTTTTYSSTSSGGGEPAAAGTSNGNYVLQGYNGTYGCPYPMSEADFESAKKSISSKSFDDSRLTVAKQIIGSNCLLCSQIKELMTLMSFEETKLELAKFAWSYNLDKGNYYKLNDAFTFESSIQELDEYTKSH